MVGWRTGTAFALGTIGGALATALLDPVGGRRRRSQVRDKVGQRARQVRSALVRRMRYEQGHVKGMAHEAARRTYLERGAPLADYEETLVDKVRSEAFRHNRHELSHVNLSAADGVVQVFGSAHGAEEATDILRRIRAVHGVKEVVSRLVVKESVAPSPESRN